jgi:membrane protease YdiL (CAAX protease family)
MTKNTSTTQPSVIPQLGLGKILLLFAWPAAWYTLLIYGIAHPLFGAGGTTPTWVLLAVTALGGGAELAVALLLLRREGFKLTLNALKDRLRLRWPRGWKAWSVAVLVFILCMGLSTLMTPLNRALASVPGFTVPAWWPAASNPNVTIQGAADVFPDIQLAGNYAFVLIYFVIGLVCNILGEELYYRGFLLPRMRGVFGRWDWVANGVLFTLKHVYQRWLYPGILIGGLGFAFAAGPLGSLPLAMLFHWLGNFFFQLIFLLQAAAGV